MAAVIRLCFILCVVFDCPVIQVSTLKKATHGTCISWQNFHVTENHCIVLPYCSEVIWIWIFIAYELQPKMCSCWVLYISLHVYYCIGQLCLQHCMWICVVSALNFIVCVDNVYGEALVAFLPTNIDGWYFWELYSVLWMLDLFFRDPKILSVVVLIQNFTHTLLQFIFSFVKKIILFRAVTDFFLTSVKSAFLHFPSKHFYLSHNSFTPQL
jgi:hypothetical protein